MSKMKISPKERYIRAMPIIKVNLKYKPIKSITKAPHYIKYVPTVYSDALNFDFAENDYELVERDRKYLKELNE